MYHCRACKVEYIEESLAKECCTRYTELEDGDFRSPRKHLKFVGGTHCCPEVTIEGRTWSTFIKSEESCPVCGWVDMSR